MEQEHMMINRTSCILCVKALVVMSLILCICRILDNHKVGFMIIGKYSPYNFLGSVTENVVHEAENAFPLAYSILAYTDLDRMIRLLRAIYRPHNCYCIHIDAKVPRDRRNGAIDMINRTFGRNVDVVPLQQSLSISWATISSVDADLLCSLRLLTVCRAKWKYWINLTGQEFPLKTNWEIVTALSLFNGTNLIAGSFVNRFEERLPKSYKSTFKIANNSPQKQLRGFVSFLFGLVKVSYAQDEFTWYYGNCHLAATRGFVEFLHRDDRSRELLDILRAWETKSPLSVTYPDESYFATMNHNPETIAAPGVFTGVHEMNAVHLVTRYKRWVSPTAVCGSGYWVRGLCMFGVKDLPVLQQSPLLFVNKLISAVEPEAYGMMEKWLDSKVKFENINNKLHSSFDPNYYISLNMSRHHL